MSGSGSGIAREFDPASGPSVEALHELLARARNQEPVFYWQPMDTWVVTRYDDVKAVLEDTEHFTLDGTFDFAQSGFAPEVLEVLHGGLGRLGITPMVGQTDGPDHRRLREAIHRSFTPRRVALLEPGIRAVIDEQIEAFVQRGSCDLVAELTYPVPVRVIFLLSGFPEGDMQRLKVWSDDLAQLLANPLSTEEQLRCARSQRAFEDYVQSVIEDRRRNLRDDFMSDLLRSIDAGEIRMEEAELLILFTVGLLMAGHETTTYAMANMVHHLLSDRSRWERVLTEPERIPDTVNESLRFDPPNIGWIRIVRKGRQLGGVRFKKGDRIFWLLASANRDHTRFENPDAFDIDRPKQNHMLTFGWGAHYCLGAQLARLEMKLLLSHLAERMPTLRLAEPGEIVYDPSPVMRHMAELRVSWDPAASH